MFFLTLCCLGLVNPNGAALALAPFAKNAGSASALLGFLQIGLGALASSGVGLFDAKDAFPVVFIMTVTACAAAFILFIGRRHVVDVGDAEGMPLPIA
jgi:DHA1 family bicyclomycin/chloramphenicol resistance-like MFS transporter